MNFFKSLNLKAVLMVLFFSAFALAQGQISFTCNLRNDYQEDANNYVFDVYMLSTGATAIEYNNMQLGFTFNSAIKNGGTVSVAMVPGYSDLPAAQQWLAANVSMVTAGIKVTVRTPTVGAGNGYIISNAGNGTRLGRFRLTNTVAFGQASPNLTWSFTTSPWPTKVFAYLPASTNITGSGTWGPGGTFVTSGLTNPVLNKPVTAFNVTGSGSYCAGGAGLAVGIDGSELGVTYTMNPGAVVMAGTGSAIDFGTYGEGTYSVTGARNATFITGNMTGSAVITTTAPVTATFAQLGPYCVGAIPALLPTTSSNGYTGTWNPPAISTASAGMVTYTFTPDGGQCALGTTMDVTVTANVTPTFTQLGPYCVGATPDVLPTTSNNGITGTWNAAISTAAAGVTTYTFTPNGGQCATSATMDVSVTTCGPETKTWVGINNLWTMATNWSPVGVPDATNPVIIPGGAAAYPTLTAPAECASFTMEHNASFIGSEFLTAGSIMVKTNVSSPDFHFLSSPCVYGINWGSIFPANQNDIWVRRYNEPTGTWANQLVVAKPTVGTGYSVETTVPGVTAMFTGALNSSLVAKTLSAANPTPGYGGWNLLGNPFTSGLDFDLCTKGPGVGGSVYVWDGAQYISWNGIAGALTGGIVPSTNGFFVWTSAPASSFNMPLTARVHGGTFFKTSASNLLELRVDGNSYKDQTFVHFNSEATQGFDEAYDAYKLYGTEGAPQLYSMIDGEVLSINERPMVGNDIVQLGFHSTVSGSFSFTASGIESFNGITPIFLEDTKLGTSQDLRTNPVYSFTYSEGENANRFKLVFGSVGINDPATSNIGVYAEHKNVHVTTPDNFRGTVQVYDILGKLVAERQVSGAGENIISLNVAGATYLVKVTNAQSSITRKVVLN